MAESMPQPYITTTDITQDTNENKSTSGVEMSKMTDEGCANKASDLSETSAVKSEEPIVVSTTRNEDSEPPKVNCVIPPPPPPAPPQQSSWNSWGSWQIPDMATVQSGFNKMKEDAQTAASNAQKKAEELLQQNLASDTPVTTNTEDAFNITANNNPTESADKLKSDFDSLLLSGSSYFQNGLSIIRNELNKVDVEDIKSKTLTAGSQAVNVMKTHIDRTKEEAEKMIREFNEKKMRDIEIEHESTRFNRESTQTVPWDEVYLTERFGNLLSVAELDEAALPFIIKSRIVSLSMITYFDLKVKLDKDYTFERWTVTTAAEILAIDPRLKELRYSLVPSKMKEVDFWAAYFLLIDELMDRTESDIVSEGISQIEIDDAIKTWEENESKEDMLETSSLNNKINSKDEVDDHSAIVDSELNDNDAAIDDLLAEVDSVSQEIDDEEIAKLIESIE